MNMKTSNVYLEAIDAIPKEIKKQTEMSFAISDRIQETLERRGWNQKQFAKKMQKTEAEISVWLSGQHNFTVKTLAKISCVLGEDIISVS